MIGSVMKTSLIFKKLLSTKNDDVICEEKNFMEKNIVLNRNMY